MSRVVKFSHRYLKMPRDYQASTLVDVFTLDARLLSESFIEYDATKFDGGLYILPRNGKVLVLMLLTSINKELWTTVRRHTPDKEKYYRGLIGQMVECKIVEVK